MGQCLESLLAQSYQPLEVIVVDDGSRDRTAEVVRRFAGVQLLSQPPRGKATAINSAAAVAAGEILMFLDADMFFDRRYVEVMVAPIAAGQCLGTCHASEHVANPDNVWSRCLQARFGLPPDRRLVIAPDELAQGSTVFRAVRRADFLRVGGFDDIGLLDDQTLYPKLRVRARFVEDAVCFHYNLESLGEVFASGRWAARSIVHLHGRGAALRYLPPVSIPRAAREALLKRRAALFVFDVVYDTGICWGLLSALG